MNPHPNRPSFRPRLLPLLLAGLTSCCTTLQEAKPDGDVVRANLNPAADPGVDFFAYANGGWLRRHPIPRTEAAWGIANVVQEEVFVKLRAINEHAAAEAQAPNREREQQQIGDFWTTAMDERKADRLGRQPLAPELARVDAVRSGAEALALGCAWQPLGVGVFFGLGVSQDEKHSERMAVHLSQGGLGLPERDFYFNAEAGVANIRREYVAHLGRVLVRLGREPAAARTAATNVMAFETALAKASRKLEDLRDPEKNYHDLSVGALTAELSPEIPWGTRLGELSLVTTNVIVGQPEFVTALAGLVKDTPVPVLQDYLRAHLVDAFAESLDGKLAAEDFYFYHRVLSGQKQPRPRWKLVLGAQEGAMGMVLGKLFVRDYFPEKTKRRYVALVEAIRGAYRERIEKLDWMSAATKARAREKLDAMHSKVGYPDHWKDYSGLVVGTNSYCENLMEAARWRWRDQVAKLGKPVDRTEWEMTPQTYNAYYQSQNNEIVLPAAMFLVPGRRDDELDDAVVYGYAAASTIGHEITHGFDDEGRKFDAAGNLKDWWTPADAEQFQKRAELMVAQFNAFEPLPGLHINGQASLGENLADYGGLLLGLDAFKLTAQYKEGKPVAGFTPMQRFFLGYALGWLAQQREESLRQRLLSDVHAPPKWRVLGPLANLPDFHAAFNVRTNQPMWRPEAQRPRVW